MIRTFCIVAALLAVAQPAFAQKPEPQKVSGRIDWVYDYEQGKLLSESTGKPMFVVIRCER